MIRSNLDVGKPRVAVLEVDSAGDALKVDVLDDVDELVDAPLAAIVKNGFISKFYLKLSYPCEKCWPSGYVGQSALV